MEGGKSTRKNKTQQNSIKSLHKKVTNKLRNKHIAGVNRTYHLYFHNLEKSMKCYCFIYPLL